MTSWTSCPSPATLQTSLLSRLSPRSVREPSPVPWHKSLSVGHGGVKKLNYFIISPWFMSKDGIAERMQNILQKFRGWSLGNCFFYTQLIFVNFLSHLFLCSPIFINFPVLLLSPVRWSLIVVAWRDFKTNKNTFLAVGEWESTLKISTLQAQDTAGSCGSCFNLWVTPATFQEKFPEDNPDIFLPC